MGIISDLGVSFWIKFFVIWIPFVVFIFFFAPNLKWKLLFSLAGIVGIVMALLGKSMKGVTPLARRGY
jgi:hypothetical protein